MNNAAEIIRFPAKAHSEERLRAASDFVDEFVPLSYVVEPILRTSSVYSLTAKTGSGKTGLAVVLALAVASGRHDVLQIDVERGRVIYCAFENPDDVRMRLMAAAWFLKVDLAEIGDKLLILDSRMKPENLVDTLNKATAAGPLALVIVDTFAAGFDGRNINDNVETGEFVRRLRPIADLSGKPAVLINAHPIKNASDDQLIPYGGGAILNEVDGNLTLAKKVSSGTTTLHHQGKFRGLEFAPISFRFELVSAPAVTDSKGRPVALPVLVRCSAGEIETHAQADVDRKILVLRAMQAKPGAKQRDLEKSLGVPRTTIGRLQTELQRAGLLEKGPVRGEWRLTAKGEREANRLKDA